MPRLVMNGVFNTILKTIQHKKHWYEGVYHVRGRGNAAAAPYL